MRVFLAGATGVIGRRLVPLLLERGHSVTGFVRRDADADWLRSLGAKSVRGDVFDADGVRRAVALAAPDVVMHQLTDLKSGNRQANSEMRVTGTRHLVDAALAAGVRRVVAQSIAWAYEAGPVPATEDVPLDLGSSGSRLRTVQGVAALEAAVREAPEWVVLRYGLLYGPGTWYARGGLMAEAAARGGLAADGERGVAHVLELGDACEPDHRSLARVALVDAVAHDERARDHARGHQKGENPTDGDHPRWRGRGFGGIRGHDEFLPCV